MFTFDLFSLNSVFWRHFSNLGLDWHYCILRLALVFVPTFTLNATYANMNATR